MLNPAAVADNAMLHKDITQWLRNKTFLTLFWGLLLMAEAVSICVAMTPTDPGQAGPISFGILTGVLSVYMLVIASSGFALTMREFQNRTFELFQLSGMSLEKMVRGKFLSMVAQFLFGFFCVVPFMFFAYLLGGLDFYVILASALTFGLTVPPLYLLSLTVALHGWRTRNASALMRVGGVLFLMFLLPNLFRVFFYHGMGGSPFFSPVELVKRLMALNGDAIKASCVFMAFHVQICMFLFYLACNAISPATDSRELQVKFLATTLTLSWMALAAGIPLASSSGGGDGMLVSFSFIGIIGLIYFWSPLEVPLMARRRASARRSILRLIPYWFQPGPWGTFRVILLYWAFSWLIRMIVPPFISLSRTGDRWLGMIALPLALPFFIAFPACFLVRFRRLRGRPAAMRTTVLIWWAVTGALLLIGTTINEEVYHNMDAPSGWLLAFLCNVVSPVSALGSLFYRDMPFTEMRAMIWDILGFIGIFLMVRTIKARAVLSSASLAKTATPPRKEQPPAPLPEADPAEAGVFIAAETAETAEAQEREH